MDIRVFYGTLEIDGRTAHCYFMGNRDVPCCFCKISLSEKTVWSSYDITAWSRREEYDMRLNNSFCNFCYEKLMILGKNKRL